LRNDRIFLVYQTREEVSTVAPERQPGRARLNRGGKWFSRLFPDRGSRQRHGL